jgi:hypothetical protein
MPSSLLLRTERDSLQMENERLGYEVHRARVEDSLRRAQSICASLFGECKAPHALAQDLLRTVKEITG